MIFDGLHALPSDAEPWIVDHEPIIVAARDERLPPGDVADAAARAATALRERGVTAGTRCIVWLELPTDVMVAYAAITALDAVPILLSPTLPGETLSEMVAPVSGVTAIVAADDRFAESRSRLEGIQHIDWREVAGALPGCRPLSRRKEVRSDAPYVVVHTSGTTSTPKLVECSSKSIRFNAMVQAVMLWMSGLREHQHLAFALSAVHGRTVVGVLAALMRKSPLLILADDSPENVERMLKRHRPAYLEAHPNTFRSWQHLAEHGAFTSVRYFGAGFDVIHPDTIRALLKGSGHGFAAFVEVYGQNESGPVAVRGYLKGMPAIRRRTRQLDGHPIGPRFPFCKVKILDDDGTPVPAGKPGRIVVRTPGVFSGYINRAGTTSRNFPRGRWWDTGDWGTKSRLGIMTLVDRQVDKISGARSGIGMEDVLLEQFPDYLELVVLDINGTVQPVLSLRPGCEYSEQAWQQATQPIATMAKPIIIPDDQFPRTATGKIKREQLKKTIAERTSASAHSNGRVG